jgi:hypothetical protein
MKATTAMASRAEIEDTLNPALVLDDVAAAAAVVAPLTTDV